MLTPNKIKMLNQYKNLFSQVKHNDVDVYLESLNADIIQKAISDYYQGIGILNVFDNSNGEKIGYTMKHGVAKSMTIPTMGLFPTIDKIFMYLPKNPNCAGDCLSIAKETVNYKYFQEHQGEFVPEVNLNSETLSLYFERAFAKHYYLTSELESYLKETYNRIKYSGPNELNNLAPLISGLAFSNYLESLASTTILEDGVDTINGVYNNKKFASFYDLDIRNPKIYDANEELILKRQKNN